MCDAGVGHCAAVKTGEFERDEGIEDVLEGASRMTSLLS